MTKYEFEKRTGSAVSEADYCIIERVYAFHPAISEADGKDQIAQLYRIGGMAIILDMVETAEMAASLEDEMIKAKTRVNWIRERQEILASGHRDYEEMLKEIEKAFESSENSQVYKQELDVIADRYPNYVVPQAQKMIGC